MVLVLCLLAAPMTTLAGKGDKNYKQGLQHESAQQWERAAEEFALAVASEPSNVEYQLHYRRAIFNASQSLTQKGRALAESGDYVGAYNAFRRAYDYDPVNELALALMDRMRRLQLEKEDTANPSGETERNVSRSTGAAPAGIPARPRITPTAYERGAQAKRGASMQREGSENSLSTTPLRAETQRVITYSGDLQSFIRYLGKQLKLNAVFDRDFPRREVEVDMEDVTAAQALDYIFLSQGLFYQKLSRRTILVADQVKRPQYQQLVLRTFFLSNIDPNDAKNLIQSAIPPQAGRQPVITPNKATNSLTVRDTPENVRLIGEILRSIDKDRAEVVMDVNIYEVSRTDLMQFGNQLGTESTLSSLGGLTKGFSILGGSRDVVTQGLGAVANPTAFGAALVFPASSISALQRKDQTRLIASTQVHAFDGEKSTAHIGQRVPIQTAAVTAFGGGTATGDNSNPQAGVNQGLFGGNGYPVIQYEKTGLTLEFTPQVFPNLDVQVKMSIKSNDVTNQGAASLTPTFTERNIDGTARIQNNRTMMIASVAQNQQSKGREGVPLLGLVPILGRLFTAPRRNNQSTDIVIAVTPHVLRAPVYSPSDEELHPTGTLQTPTSDTLEAMLQEVEHEEQLVAARSLPRNSVVELPDAPPPSKYEEPHTFIPSPKASTAAGVTSEETARIPTVAPQRIRITAPAVVATARRSPEVIEAAFVNPTGTDYDEVAVEDIDLMSVKMRPPATGSGTSPTSTIPAPPAAPAPRSAAELRLIPEQQSMRVGDKRLLKLVLKTDAPLGLLAAKIHFDPRIIAVNTVKPGNLFAGMNGSPSITPNVDAEGLLLLAVTPPGGEASITGAGVLLLIEVEAIARGTSSFHFDETDVHLITSDGRNITVKATHGQITVQ